MSRSRKQIIRDGSIAFVVSLGVSVGVAVALPDNYVQASQDGQRNYWTASQKANAIQVLTSNPVNESPDLAACVINEIAQEHTFTEFLDYATMAAADDFSNPDRTQTDIINSLMYDALVCPESH